MRLKRKPLNSTAMKSHSGLGKVKTALVKVSNDKRKEELSATHHAPPQKNSGTTVTVNVKGNLRGMHTAAHPPSSEEMKKKRMMRKLWNKQMPVLQCNNCAFSSQCPQYKAGYECAFLPFLHSHTIETAEELIEAAKDLLGENLRRAQLSMMMETLSGQQPSLETGEQMGMLFTQMMQLHERMTAPDMMVSIQSDDRTIIGSLFGGMTGLMESTRKAQLERLEVPLIQNEGQEALTLDLPSGDKVNNAEVNSELLTELAVSTVAPSKENQSPPNELQG